MAAGSTLNGAVKYVYPNRHLVGGKRTNKLHNGKKTRAPKQQMPQLFQKPEEDTDVVRKKRPQNMLTKERAIFWDHFGVKFDKCFILSLIANSYKLNENSFHYHSSKPQQNSN